MQKFVTGKYKLEIDGVVDIEIGLSASEVRTLKNVLPLIAKNHYKIDFIQEADRATIYKSRK